MCPSIDILAVLCSVKFYSKLDETLLWCVKIGRSDDGEENNCLFIAKFLLQNQEYGSVITFTLCTNVYAHQQFIL